MRTTTTTTLKTTPETTKRTSKPGLIMPSRAPSNAGGSQLQDKTTRVSTINSTESTTRLPIISNITTSYSIIVVTRAPSNVLSIVDASSKTPQYYGILLVTILMLQ